MYKNKAVIDEIISILKDEIAKNNIYTNMGTSVDEGMSHQQSNYIKKHFNDLLNELKDMNISSIDDTITGAQLQQLYKSGKAKYNWPEFSFDEKYQYDVFKLLSNPSEREIPVREFIKEYILLIIRTIQHLILILFNKFREEIIDFLLIDIIRRIDRN